MGIKRQARHEPHKCYKCKKALKDASFTREYVAGKARLYHYHCVPGRK